MENTVETVSVLPITTLTVIATALAGLLCGALGPFLVWKRLGLLGDAVSHASLMVVALALALGFPSAALLIPFAIAIGFLLSKFQEKQFSELDSVLAVFFAGFMGIGLIIMSISGKGSEEILHALFGDVQTLLWQDLAMLGILNVIVLAYLFRFKRELRLLILQPDLAQIEGINRILHTRALMILTAVTVAICLKLMGVVLVTILFVAPALISLTFSRSANQHALLSVGFGVGISLGGLAISKVLMLPTSASIAALGLLVFLAAGLFRGKRA